MYRHLIKRASAVMEALPYLMKFHGKTVVIKYGGAAMTQEELRQGVAQDAVLLKYVGINPVIVHGGGQFVTRYLKRKKIDTRFVSGHRVTGKRVLDAVERVLGGKVNREIVRLIKRGGGRAKGLFGKKGKVIKARKLWVKNEKGKWLDLGYTGKVVGIKFRYLRKLMKRGIIPVISPIGVGTKGRRYNINADAAAAAVASFLKAEKLILLTDVRGVLDKKGKFISEVDAKKIKKMIKSKAIRGGMIPKVKNGLAAISNGVESVHIVDGRVPHAVLLEIFTDRGIGTMVVR